NIQFVIGDGTRFFNQTQGVDMGRFKSLTRNWKVFDSALGLRRIQGMLWYPDFAHGVVFDTELLIIRLRCHNSHPSWELPWFILISALVGSQRVRLLPDPRYHRFGPIHQTVNKLLPLLRLYPQQPLWQPLGRYPLLGGPSGQCVL